MNGFEAPSVPASPTSPHAPADAEPTRPSPGPTPLTIADVEPLTPSSSVREPDPAVSTADLLDAIGQSSDGGAASPSDPVHHERVVDETDDASGELVRSFMITGGRTRTDVPEVEIETIVCARSELAADRSGLRREQRLVLDVLHGPMSVAEVAAHLGIPLRAAVIITSELVAAGAVVAGRNADTGDTDFLLQIRQALQLL